MSGNLLDIFCSHKGIISVVGAGGKKSTIFRLASEHRGRIAITSTVYTPPFRKRLNALEVIADHDSLFKHLAEASSSSKRVAYAHPSEKSARLRGVDAKSIRLIHEKFQFDTTFVKADGARLRWLKAPDENEPALAQGTTVLVPVLSIRAIGKILSGEIAHRTLEVARVMQIEIGQRITPLHLARLVSSEQGALKGAGSAKVIVVLNMIENKQELSVARLVADQALERSAKINRIVLASMAREDPVLQVVER